MPRSSRHCPIGCKPFWCTGVCESVLHAKCMAYDAIQFPQCPLHRQRYQLLFIGRSGAHLPQTEERLTVKKAVQAALGHIHVRRYVQKMRCSLAFNV